MCNTLNRKLHRSYNALLRELHRSYNTLFLVLLTCINRRMRGGGRCPRLRLLGCLPWTAELEPPILWATGLSHRSRGGYASLIYTKLQMFYHSRKTKIINNLEGSFIMEYQHRLNLSQVRYRIPAPSQFESSPL